MINIFVSHITSRLRYVLDFCFAEKGETYELYTDANKWRELDEQTINYSTLDLPANLTVQPQGILYESDLYPHKKLTQNSSGHLEIDGVADYFGIIFFLLVRYEEHFEGAKDAHERFPAQRNMLVQLNLQEEPVVDILVKDIWEKAQIDYSEVLNSYRLLPSFDIDVAWAYKNRSFVRSAGAMLKGKRPVERLKVLSGVQKDPYDTYDQIIEIAEENDCICFFLLGDWGKYDKNIHWKNKALRGLINRLKDHVEVGIHPSYGSYLNEGLVRGEIDRLQTITNAEVINSRQHFLRLQLPETYGILESCGIKNDYSMGFADSIGFRAGTSFSHYYFDLRTNKRGNLKITPFVYMDSALKDYLKLSPEVSRKKISELTNKVKSVGGTFCFIWHNSSIHNTDEWEEWGAVLNHTLQNI